MAELSPKNRVLKKAYVAWNRDGTIHAIHAGGKNGSDLAGGGVGTLVPELYRRNVRRHRFPGCASPGRADIIKEINNQNGREI